MCAHFGGDGNIWPSASHKCFPRWTVGKYEYSPPFLGAVTVIGDDVG